MAPRPVIRDATKEVLDEIADENDYSSVDRAVAHALREAGYDV